MPESLALLKKAIHYKANHRGSLEADFLIGRFVAHILPTLCEADVITLKAWLEMDDASFFAQLEYPEPPYQTLVHYFQSFKEAL
jgi:succinate dehydrogenase flavin-adding protein (antitoxin of CptAB toxin-antitoxin module)